MKFLVLHAFFRGGGLIITRCKGKCHCDLSSLTLPVCPQILTHLARPVRQHRLFLIMLLTCLCLFTKIFTLKSPSIAVDASPSADATAQAADPRHPLGPSAPSPSSSRYRRSATDPDSGTRTVYVITASYPRPEQEADLVRLSQTLMHSSLFVFWVLVEDSANKTPAVEELLQRSGLRHVHLLGKIQRERLVKPDEASRGK